MERSFEFDGYTGKLVVYEANKNTNYGITDNKHRFLCRWNKIWKFKTFDTRSDRKGILRNNLIDQKAKEAPQKIWFIR